MTRLSTLSLVLFGLALSACGGAEAGPKLELTAALPDQPADGTVLRVGDPATQVALETYGLIDDLDIEVEWATQIGVVNPRIVPPANEVVALELRGSKGHVRATFPTWESGSLHEPEMVRWSQGPASRAARTTLASPLGDEDCRIREHDEVVLAAGRRLVGGGVRDRLDRLVPRGLGLVSGGLRHLHRRGQLLDLREQGLLLLALRLGDERAAGLLLGPLGLEVGDRLPARVVRRQRPVHHVGGQAALGLGGAYAVGVVTEEAGIDHPRRLSGGAWGGRPGLGILRG